MGIGSSEQTSMDIVLHDLQNWRRLTLQVGNYCKQKSSSVPYASKFWPEENRDWFLTYMFDNLRTHIIEMTSFFRPSFNYTTRFWNMYQSRFSEPKIYENNGCGQGVRMRLKHGHHRSKLGVLGRGHTKETGNRNATSISEKCRRFPAGNWFPD
jgi:hypothetical protein